MAQVSVTLVRADTNQEFDVELPDDANIGELLPALVKELGLPLTGPDGNQVAYELANKRTGREYKETESLGAVGTKTGDVILLTSTFVAGSAFLVSKNHLHYLVAACVEYGVIEKGKENEVGLKLLFENIASLNARYNGSACEFFASNDPKPEEYVFVPTKVEPVQVLKAAQCYSYQSCEHDGWQSSESCKLIDLLLAAALLKLPARSREIIFDARSDRRAERVYSSSAYDEARWAIY